MDWGFLVTFLSYFNIYLANYKFKTVFSPSSVTLGIYSKKRVGNPE
jgi:hypothetical protein